jgi:hypothetical protein
MCDFLRELACDGKWESRAKLKIIDNLRNGLRSSSVERMITAVYRSRGRQMWNDYNSEDSSDDDDDDDKYKRYLGVYDDDDDNNNSKNQKANYDMLIQLATAYQNDFRRNDKNNFADSYIKEQLNSLSNLRPIIQQQQDIGDEERIEVIVNGIWKPIQDTSIEYNDKSKSNEVKNLVNSFIKQIKLLKRVGIVNINDNTTYSLENQESKQLDASKKVSHLNPKQKLVYDMVMSALENENNSEQLLLSVNDGPGVGKTYTMQVIEQVIESKDNYISNIIVNMATTGSAASVFGFGSRTFHSSLSIGQKNRNSDGSLKKIKTKELQDLKELFKNTKCFLIDEVSMLTPSLLKDISDRLNEIYEIIETDDIILFGGKHIILVGDFQQIPPIGECLYTGVLRYFTVLCEQEIKMKYHQVQASELYAKFKIIFLTDFQRASETDFIFRGILTKIRDLNCKYPIKDSNILDALYKRILTNDEANDSFSNAKLGVTSNPERYALNTKLIQDKAIQINSVVLKWENELINFPDKAKELEVYLREQNDGELHGFFLKDTPVFITDNLCPALLVANGTSGTLHSIIYYDDDIRNNMIENINTANKGEIILVQKPDCVIIKIKKDSTGSITNIIKKYENLKLDSIDNNSIDTNTHFLFPLISKGSNYNDKQVYYGPSTEAKNKKCYIKYKSFDYDIGYAVTAHKLQGETIDNIVIELNQRPVGLKHLDLSSLYVMISRVKSLNNLRIMPFRKHYKNPSVNEHNFLDYLLALKQSDKLKVWYDCLSPISNKDPNILMFDPNKFRDMDMDTSSSSRKRKSNIVDKNVDKNVDENVDKNKKSKEVHVSTTESNKRKTTDGENVNDNMDKNKKSKGEEAETKRRTVVTRSRK